ncbi:MAG: hypothetical protein EOP84_27005, partial [Verrucomicrobiaceae bacterium]
MPEPISLIGIAAVSLGGGAALRDFSSRNSGVSNSARFLAKEAKDLVEKNDRSISWMGSRSAIISELMGLQSEHGVKGWDGADAPPVNLLALEKARDLILALPTSIPDPELAVDPDDGAISLEWYAGPSR